MSTVESPCIDVCRMNPRTRLCDGCARTLREIGSWGQLTAAQRRAVMAELPARRAAVAAARVAPRDAAAPGED